jgi:hypothetical protein
VHEGIDVTTRKTLVRCRCHGRIAQGPAYKSPWEDVWLRWDSAPGEVATTLKSRAELLADLKASRELHGDDPANPYWIGQIAQFWARCLAPPAP